MLEKCVSLQFKYPEMIWPYFGNIKMTLLVEDAFECRYFSKKDVEVKISFILRNLGTI